MVIGIFVSGMILLLLTISGYRIKALGIFTTILIAFATFRTKNMGPDTIEYYRSFNKYVNNISFKSDFELGYKWLEKTIAEASLSIHLLFFIIAAMSLVTTALFYRKFARIPMAAMLYYFARYFLSRDTNQMREGLACSLMLWGIYWLYKKQYGRFVLITIFASLFHKVSLIFLLIAICNKIIKKLSLKGYLISFVIVAGLSSLIGKVVLIVANAVGIGDAYTSYSEYVGSGGLTNPIMLLELLIVIGIFLTYKTRPYTEFELYCTKLYAFGSLILVATNAYYVLGSRISTIITNVEPLLFIILIQGMVTLYLPKDRKWRTLLQGGAIMLYICLIFMLIDISSGLIDYF